MGQSVQSSSSPWMAHWTQKSCSGGVRSTANQSSDTFGKMKNEHDACGHHSASHLQIAIPNVLSAPKGLKPIESSPCRAASDSLRMSFTCTPNEQATCYKDSRCEIEGTSKALQGNQAASNFETLQLRNNHHSENSSPRWFRSDSGLRLQITNEPLQTLTPLEDGCCPTLSPSVEKVPHNLKSGLDNSHIRKSFFSPLRDKPVSASKEQLSLTNLRSSECEGYNRYRHSSFLARMKKSGEHSKAEKSIAAACFQENIASPTPIDLTSNNRAAASGGEHSQKTWNFSGRKRNWSNLPEKNSSDKLDHAFSSLAKFQSSTNKVETTRICTTVDSVVGVSGGHSRFSQTTHSLFITRKTDFNLLKAEEIYRNSRGPTDFGIHPFSNLTSVSPSSGHVQRRVTLRSLHGFADSEGPRTPEGIYGVSKFAYGDEKKVEDAKDFDDSMDRKGKRVVHYKAPDLNLDGESSAETDILDLGNFEGTTQVYGVNPSSSVKAIKLGSAAPRLALCSRGEEDGPGRRLTKLPDMNLEVPSSSTEEQMLDYEEPSTSRTQSLDIETLLEQVSPLDSVNGLSVSLKPEPGGRWLKRLKLCASSSYVGTKSSNLGDKTLPEGHNFPLQRGFKSGKATSEPTASRNHDTELTMLNKAMTLKPHSWSSCSDSIKKDTDLLLSQSWIRRWSHHDEAAEDPNAGLVGEPQSSKLLLENIEKKQFPSIAAMALMAKALKGIKRSDIQNKGAFVVWNSKCF